MTNREFLFSLPDEELAKLYLVFDNDTYGYYPNFDTAKNFAEEQDAILYVVDWLNQEYR